MKTTNEIDNIPNGIDVVSFNPDYLKLLPDLYAKLGTKTPKIAFSAYVQPEELNEIKKYNFNLIEKIPIRREKYLKSIAEAIITSQN